MPRGYTKMMRGTAASTARNSHRRKPWQQQASARIPISELSVPTASQKGKKKAAVVMFFKIWQLISILYIHVLLELLHKNF